MDFWTAVRTCFAKYVTFSGRARRAEYWYFALFTLLASLAAGILDLALFDATEDSLQPIGTILSLGLLLPSIAVTFRRLHDLDRAGWWILLLLVPFIGVIVLLVFLCLRGTPGTNRFGDDPLAVSAL